MANLVPDGAEYDIATRVNAVPAITAGVIPSNAHVSRELKRYQRVQGALANGGRLSDAQYTEAAVRQFRVLQSKSGPVGDPGIQQQLTQIQNSVNGLNTRVDGINTRLDGIQAIASSSSARFLNWRRCSPNAGPNWKAANFVPIVKIVDGHPFLPRPLVPGVQFAAPTYVAGSEPPPGLLPVNYNAIDDWRAQWTNDQLMQMFRGLHWFYNDARFQLADNAPIEEARAALNTIEDFFWYQ